MKLYRNWIINEVARAGEHTNERTYVLTYIRTGQTLYPLHNFVVRGDKKTKQEFMQVNKYYFWKRGKGRLLKYGHLLQRQGASNRAWAFMRIYTVQYGKKRTCQKSCHLLGKAHCSSDLLNLWTWSAEK